MLNYSYDYSQMEIVKPIWKEICLQTDLIFINGLGFTHDGASISEIGTLTEIFHHKLQPYGVFWNP